MEEVPGRRHRHAPSALLAVVAAASAACLDSPPDTGSERQQLLADPAFEEGAGWTVDEGTVELSTTGELDLPPSEAGQRVALLGGADDEIDVIMQLVAVPTWARQLELSGVRCFTTGEGFETEYDEFWIFLETEDGSTSDVLFASSNLDATWEGCQWMPFSVTTSAHAGDQVWFIVEAVTDPDIATSFAIDGLALTAVP